jgi:hypothetical protein
MHPPRRTTFAGHSGSATSGDAHQATRKSASSKHAVIHGAQQSPAIVPGKVSGYLIEQRIKVSAPAVQGSCLLPMSCPGSITAEAFDGQLDWAVDRCGSLLKPGPLDVGFVFVVRTADLSCPQLH